MFVLCNLLMKKLTMDIVELFIIANVGYQQDSVSDSPQPCAVL